MKNKKLFRIVIIITVVAIILAIIGKRVGWFGKEEVIEVAVEQGKIRVITETITANGKIQPETEVKLTPEVSGEIVERVDPIFFSDPLAACNKATSTV